LKKRPLAITFTEALVTEPSLKQYSTMIYADSSIASFVDSVQYLKKGQSYSYAVVAVNTNNQKSPISVRVIANPLKKRTTNTIKSAGI
jgi:hypothetical protein